MAAVGKTTDNSTGDTRDATAFPAGGSMPEVSGKGDLAGFAILTNNFLRHLTHSLSFKKNNFAG